LCGRKKTIGERGAGGKKVEKVPVSPLPSSRRDLYARKGVASIKGKKEVKGTFKKEGTQLTGRCSGKVQQNWYKEAVRSILPGANGYLLQATGTEREGKETWFLRVPVVTA